MFNNFLYTDEMRRLPQILPEYLPQYMPVMTAFKVYITTTNVAYTVTEQLNDICLCGCSKVVARNFIHCLCCRGLLCFNLARDFDICVMCTSTIFPQFMIQQCMLFYIFCMRCVSNCLWIVCPRVGNTTDAKKDLKELFLLSYPCHMIPVDALNVRY